MLDLLLHGWNTLSRKGMPAEVTRRGALFAAQRIPDLSHLVAQGKVWTGGEAHGTTTTLATAMPTTTAGISLQNGENDGGKLLIVLGVYAYSDVSPAAVSPFGIVHCIDMDVQDTYMTRDLTRTSIKPYLGGGGAYDGKAILDLAATVVDNLWRPVTPAVSNYVASTSFAALVHQLIVPVVLKPRAAYHIEGLSDDATTEAALGFIWAEVEPEELE